MELKLQVHMLENILKPIDNNWVTNVNPVPHSIILQVLQAWALVPRLLINHDKLQDGVLITRYTWYKTLFYNQIQLTNIYLVPRQIHVLQTQALVPRLQVNHGKLQNGVLTTRCTCYKTLFYNQISHLSSLGNQCLSGALPDHSKCFTGSGLSARTSCQP